MATDFIPISMWICTVKATFEEGVFNWRGRHPLRSLCSRVSLASRRGRVAPFVDENYERHVKVSPARGGDADRQRGWNV